MADFVAFMKGRCTLKAAAAAGQAQCSMTAAENVLAQEQRGYDELYEPRV